MSKPIARVLMVNESAEEARWATEALRAGGWLVNTRRVQDEASLLDALKTPWDVVLSELKVGDCHAQQVLTLTQKLAPGIPVIVFTGQIDENQIDVLMLAGACDVLSSKEPWRVFPAVRREMQVACDRRALITANQSFHDLDMRYRHLFQASGAPVCYCHEGMHVQANQAYLSLFGFTAQDEIEGVPLLNLVDKSNHGHLKQILKTGPDSVEIEVALLTADGARPDANMKLVRVVLDGEPCIQVTLYNIKATDAPLVEECDTANEKISDDGIASPALVRVSDDSADALSDEWRVRLDTAVRGEKIYLQFQPIINLCGEPAKYYAVLPRLIDENNAPVSYVDFVHMADLGGYTQDIHRIIFSRLIESMTEARAKDEAMRFFIPLSGRILDDNEMAGVIQQGVWKHLLEAESMIFEVDGAALMKGLSNSGSLVRSLAYSGFRFSMINAGAGLKEVGQLRGESVEFVAIESIFTENLLKNGIHSKILGSLIQIAQALQKKTLALGIDNREIVSKLWEYQIDYVQGNALQQASSDLHYNFADEVTIESNPASPTWMSS